MAQKSRDMQCLDNEEQNTTKKSKFRRRYHIFIHSLLMPITYVTVKKFRN
jgi:hypothetical protein